MFVIRKGISLDIGVPGEIVVPEPEFCALPTLASISSTKAALVVDEIDPIKITVTRTADTDTDNSSVFVSDSATAFSAETSLVQQNFVYKSMVSEASDLSQFFGVSIMLYDTVAQQPICSAALALRQQGAINTGVAIIDTLSGWTVDDVLVDDLSLAENFEFALFIQTGDTPSAYVGYKLTPESATQYISLAKFNEAYNPENALVSMVAISTGTTKDDAITGLFNQGSQAFGVTDTGAVSWCEADVGGEEE